MSYDFKYNIGDRVDEANHKGFRIKARHHHEATNGNTRNTYDLDCGGGVYNEDQLAPYTPPSPPFNVGDYVRVVHPWYSGVKKGDVLRVGKVNNPFSENEWFVHVEVPGRSLPHLPNTYASAFEPAPAPEATTTVELTEPERRLLRAALSRTNIVSGHGLYEHWCTLASKLGTYSERGVDVLKGQLDLHEWPS